MAAKGIQVELLLSGVMDDGDVALAGGKVYTYAAGTLTNKTTWTDRDKTTPAANPVILDAAGKAQIFANGVYKFVITDANDVPIRTLDNLEFGQIFTGIFNLSKGADIASASALELGSDGNYFDVTGTEAITSIGTVGVGTVIKLHFDSVLTLTYDETDLILLGGTDIVTAAGDEAEFVEYATGVWICTKYSKTRGAPNTTKGADVASATALSLGAYGNYFNITGTTAITSIDTIGVGLVIKLHFDAILTLTHHATNLILPGGTNIVTVAGDEAEFIEYATGVWICTNYQTATNTPTIASFADANHTHKDSAGGGTIFLSSLAAVTASGSGTQPDSGSTGVVLTDATTLVFHIFSIFKTSGTGFIYHSGAVIDTGGSLQTGGMYVYISHIESGGVQGYNFTITNPTGGGTIGFDFTVYEITET